MEIRNPALLDKDNQAREMASDVTPCAHNPGERSDTRGKISGEHPHIAALMRATILASCGLRRQLRKHDLMFAAATIQPDGQINQEPVHPFAQKYSARAVGQISD